MCGIVFRFFVHGGILIGVLKAVVDEEMSILTAGLLAIGATIVTLVSMVVCTVGISVVSGPVVGVIAGITAGGMIAGILLGVVISALFGTEIKQSMWAGGLYVVLAVMFEGAMMLVLYLMSSPAAA